MIRCSRKHIHERLQLVNSRLVRTREHIKRGWSRIILLKEDLRKMLELYHMKQHKDHADNNKKNLSTLCNLPLFLVKHAKAWDGVFHSGHCEITEQKYEMKREWL